MQLFTLPQPEMRLPETVVIGFSRGSSEVFVNFTKKTMYCRRTSLRENNFETDFETCGSERGIIGDFCSYRVTKTRNCLLSVRDFKKEGKPINMILQLIETVMICDHLCWVYVAIV